MRRTGRTTRIIDQAVQDLFKNGFVIICDHHFSSENLGHKHAFKIFLKRLSSEHNGLLRKLKVDNRHFGVYLPERREAYEMAMHLQEEHSKFIYQNII